MSFPYTIHGPDQKVYDTDTSAEHPLGQKFETPDGRVFRYALVDGATVTACRLVQTKAGDDNIIDLDVQAAAAVGATSVAVTNATTFFSANDLTNGFIVLYEVATPATGGQTYRIYTNTATSASSTTNTIAFVPGVTLQTAITTSTDAETTWCPWFDIVASTGAAPTGKILGVAGTAISDNAYGWVQSRGPAGVIVDDGAALDVGDNVTASTDVGSVQVAAADDVEYVGTALTNSAADDYGLVFLKVE